MKSSVMVFRARAERGFLLSVIVSSIAAFVLALCVVPEMEPVQAVLIFCLFLIIAVFTWPIQYDLRADRMRWRIGVAINRSVPFSEIDRVALSQGRTGLTFRKVPGHTLHAGLRKVFFSAQDQERLLQVLLARSPHLKQYGFEWRREIASGGSGD